jgi:hypothetical protein
VATLSGGGLAFRFEMWHERLLAAAHAHREPDAVEERPPAELGSSGGGGTSGGGGGDGDVKETIIKEEESPR